MKEQIKTLIREFHSKRQLTDEDIKQIISQPNHYLFTHEEDGKLVAMTVLYTIELFTRKLGVIEEVVTLLEYRRRGIATSLVKNAIEKARQLGLDCIELNVNEQKVEVQEFYKKLGFIDRKNKAFRLWLK